MLVCIIFRLKIEHCNHKRTAAYDCLSYNEVTIGRPWVSIVSLRTVNDNLPHPDILPIVLYDHKLWWRYGPYLGFIQDHKLFVQICCLHCYLAASRCNDQDGWFCKAERPCRVGRKDVRGSEGTSSPGPSPGQER